MFVNVCQGCLESNRTCPGGARDGQGWNPGCCQPSGVIGDFASRLPAGARSEKSSRDGAAAPSGSELEMNSTQKMLAQSEPAPFRLTASSKLLLLPASP